MYDRSILAKSTGASLGVVAVVGMLFLSTGTAFAAPISGIGGFSIVASSIEGDNIILYPGDGDAENYSQAYPQGIVELDGTEIDDLQLIKNFNLDQYGLTGNARLVITAADDPNEPNVTSGQLLLKTPKLSADRAVFSGLTIDEKNAADTRAGIKNVITLRAPESPTTSGASADIRGGPRQISLNGGSNPGLQLRNANIRATYLATNEITLPGLELEVQFDNDNDGTYEFA